MTDDELSTLVRLQRGTVRMSTPLEQIVGRGRAVRARRRLPAVTAALALVAGAVLAIGALTTAGQPSARLAAWTVARRADGTIAITIRDLRDAAGLQRTLRADGVPATVDFVGGQRASCARMHGQPWSVGTQAGGAITLAIGELRDPGGLQRRLRADGIRASVSFPGHHTRHCPGGPIHGRASPSPSS